MKLSRLSSFTPNTVAALPSRFNFFRAVLADGRRIENVEGEVGPLLSKWLPLLLKSPAKKDALQLTINLIKFQSSNTDSNVISAYVK